MVSRHIRSHGIDLRLGEELAEIVDDGNGRACAVITKSGERIDCGYVGLTAGVHPNVDFLRDSEIEIDRGILVDDNLRTNQPDIYAIGDCAQIRNPKPGRRNIEAVWYTGRMMGEVAAYNALGKEVAYDPGIWFNSAKFMDIEYQVYGDVPAKALPDHLDTVYWEHPDGDKAVRIYFEKPKGRVTGFNLMGVRYRQEVCQKWLAEGTGIEEVLRHLGLANFDPEFYREYEADIVAQYNAKTGSNLQLQQRRGLPAVLKFLTR
jgi:NADPH-dependent 2,4-dienoyl-CoA reductase/sulfur reductase-like enzyme